VIPLLLLSLFAVLFMYFDGHEAVRPTWREIKGVTRFLLSGPEPTPNCRACGKELPDPMLREALGHGAFVCEPCNDEIELEVGLAYPSWWTEKEPPALNAVPPPTTYNCAGCGNEHPKDHVCLVELKKYVSHPPGDDDLSDDWFRVRAHVVCPEPRMNVVVTAEGARLRAKTAKLEDMSDDDFMEFFKKQIP
jgi:hypothetical protein